MPTQVQYPFDPTGNLPSNRILGEEQKLTPSAYRDFHFIVPHASPFFANSIVLRHRAEGSSVSTPLQENVHYIFTHKYWEATLSTGKPVYGSITFLNKNLGGIIELVEYRTIGGKWVLRTQAEVERLFNSTLNPAEGTWSQVINYPYAFPPTVHDHNVVDMVGQTELVNAIMAIASAIEAAASTGSPFATLSQALATPARPDLMMSPMTTRALAQSIVDAGNAGTLKNILYSLFNAQAELTANLYGASVFFKTLTQNSLKLDYSGSSYVMRQGFGDGGVLVDGIRGEVTADRTIAAPSAYPADFWAILSINQSDLSALGSTAPVLATVTTAWTTNGSQPSVTPPAGTITKIVHVARATSAGVIEDKRVLAPPSNMLGTKASLDSPEFTGTPRAPTAAPGNSSTQLSNTAFVAAAIAPLAPKANPTFTGDVTVPTGALGANNALAANHAFVAAAINALALVARTGNASDLVGVLPAAKLPFTYSANNTPSHVVQRDSNGTFPVPTAALGSNNANVANHAFVAQAIAALALVARSGNAADLIGVLNAAQLPFAYSSAVAANAVVQRDANGAIQVPTPIASSNGTNVPNTEWIQTLLNNRFNNAILHGTPTTGSTPLLSDYSTAIVNSGWVKALLNSSPRLTNGMYFGNTSEQSLLDAYMELNRDSTVGVRGSPTTGVTNYTLKTNRQTVIGQRVFFTIALTWNSTTAAGNVVVTNVGSTPDQTTIFSEISLGGFNRPAGAKPIMIFDGGTNAVSASLYWENADGSFTPVQMVNVGSININGNYIKKAN